MAEEFHGKIFNDNVKLGETSYSTEYVEWLKSKLQRLESSKDREALLGVQYELYMAASRVCGYEDYASGSDPCVQFRTPEESEFACKVWIRTLTSEIARLQYEAEKQRQAGYL